MFTDKNLKIVTFGEVLWDVFTDEKKIGGAPLNVALRLKSLGCQVAIISAIGNDTEGKEIIVQLNDFGLPTNSIAVLNNFPTGSVNITLTDTKSANYQINHPAAWDKIIVNDFTKQKIRNADILIFGSLICRDLVSRSTLLELLKINIYKVFDVNLRKPHYTYEIIEQLMQSANFIKFNDEELLEIASYMNSPSQDLEENIHFIAKKTNTLAICVTKGKDGALLLWKNQIYTNKGYPAKVVDTVGAGDSFLAVLIASLFSGQEAQTAIDFACAIGALVAESPGANPKISAAQIAHLIKMPTR